MKIAIASGKGGTGKTTVATNLAHLASRSGRSVAYLDCDVEEPNGHVFLAPEITRRTPIGELIPKVDDRICTLCGKCSEMCRYSAIACLGKNVLVYPELCHGCGGCTLICPVQAIREVARHIGNLEAGQAGSIRYVQGVLNVGEARAVPLIKAVRSTVLDVDLAFIDAPPGTACPVIEAIRGADFVVLVTEPTPFGLHDLNLAVETTGAMGLPIGVVVNRASLDGRELRSYCAARHIPILAEIRDDRRLAVAYSRGEIVCEEVPEYRAVFAGLLEKVARAVSMPGRRGLAS